jgi:hypothetical protein
VGTGILALDLLSRERTGTPVVETALDDMAGEVETARKDFLDALPATADERRLHREVDAALERAQAALTLARHALAAKDAADGPEQDTAQANAQAALAKSAKELGALRQRLGTGR